MEKIREKSGTNIWKLKSMYSDLSQWDAQSARYSLIT